jgi:hypothetical protein
MSLPPWPLFGGNFTTGHEIISHVQVCVQIGGNKTHLNKDAPMPMEKRKKKQGKTTLIEGIWRTRRLAIF